MIGKEITELLKANTDLTDIVPGVNIFPYIINEDTPLPTIIYTINGSAPDYNKTGYAGEMVRFTILCLSRDYGQLQDITNEVRAALEFKTASPRIINRIYLTGYDEAFNLSEEIYIARLNFETYINFYTT